MIHCICAPVGGYMNHLRWLLLLSGTYTKPWGKAQNNVKFNFIKSQIYSEDRSCFNWLDFEWKFRTKSNLQDMIFVSHDLDKINIINQPKKVVALYLEPSNALFHYLKMNPALNGMSEELFLDSITNHKNKLSEINAEEILHVQIDKLYNETLDKEIYDNIVNFLNIDNEYEVANDVHKLWYNINKQGEVDMKNIPKSVDQFPWTSKSGTSRLTEQSQYDKLLLIINKVYGNA